MLEQIVYQLSTTEYHVKIVASPTSVRLALVTKNIFHLLASYKTMATI